jgi:hypothetical protein
MCVCVYIYIYVVATNKNKGQWGIQNKQNTRLFSLPLPATSTATSSFPSPLFATLAHLSVTAAISSGSSVTYISVTSQSKYAALNLTNINGIHAAELIT